MPVSSEVSARLAMMERRHNDPEREKKDKEFSEMLKSLEMESAKTLHSIKSKKRELRGAQRESRRRVANIKEERLSREYNTSERTRKAIEKTFAELELAGKAHTLSEWCEECGCIHLEDLLRHEEGAQPHDQPHGEGDGEGETL